MKTLAVERESTKKFLCQRTQVVLLGKEVCEIDRGSFINCVSWVQLNISLVLASRQKAYCSLYVYWTSPHLGQ